MEMKYLITGSSGFIGKHLTKTIIQNDSNFVYGIDRKSSDITNTNYKHIAVDLKDDIEYPEVDVVIHLAAYNGTKFFYSKPLEVINDNIIPTLKLIEHYKTKSSLFVYAGTPESVAGATDFAKLPLPSKEDYPIIIEDVMNPRWSYANSKTLSEQAVIHSGMDYMIIRYHNVYGEGQIDHFIPDFISRAKQNKFVLHGHDNTRSFMYIDDAIKVTLSLMKERNAKNQIINVGSDEEVTIKEVAKIILNKMNLDAEIEFFPAPEGSVSRRQPDTQKMKKILPDLELTSVEQGIEKLLK
jgi:nucleoside-diphosphate-sugar epimerase